MKVIAVDCNDQFLKFVDKSQAHQKNGILHRAFSVIVVNNKGEVLIQQRSKFKKLWPLFWSNTCCSHPTVSRHPDPDVTSGEGSLTAQAEKRLKEEFGFNTKLKFIYKFYYKAVYKNVGSETELCHVFLGTYNGRVKPNSREINNYKWVNLNWLIKDIVSNSSKYTPWFKLEIKEMVKRKMLR